MAQIGRDARTVAYHVHSHVGTENFAVGAIFIAFAIYITAKGKLGTYIQLFFYAPPATPASTQAGDQPIAGTTTAGTPGLTANPFVGLPFGLGAPFVNNPAIYKATPPTEGGGT